MFGGNNTGFGRPQSNQFTGGMSTLGQGSMGAFGGNTGNTFGSGISGGGSFGSGGAGLLRSSPSQSGNSPFGGASNGGFGGFQSQSQSQGFGSSQTVNTGFNNNTGGFGGNRNGLGVNTQPTVGFGSQMGGGNFGGMSNTGSFGNQNRLGSSPGMGQGMAAGGFGMSNTMNSSMGSGGFGAQMNTFGNQASPSMGGNQVTPVGTAQYNPQAPLVVKDVATDARSKKKVQVDCPFHHICAPRSANDVGGFAGKSQEELRWEDIQMKNGNSNPPQYGNNQQSMGLGGGMGGLGNAAKPGGFGNTGFGQQATNQQSPFGNTGLGLGAQQPTNTGGFGGFGNTAGGLGGGKQTSGFGTSGGIGGNTQASPFGSSAPNQGFGASSGFGQSSGGATGGFGANSNTKPNFGGFGGSNTQTSTGFGTGATSQFGTGAGTGFNTTTNTFGATGGNSGAFAPTTPNTTSLGASTTAAFGNPAATAVFGNTGTSGGGLGFGSSTSQSSTLGSSFGAKPTGFGSSAGGATLNFGASKGATNQSAAPSTGGFSTAGAFGGTGTFTLGTGTTSLGGGGLGTTGSFGSLGGGFGLPQQQAQSQQQQLNVQQQQLNAQQQQQFVNPMISIKDKVTSLRSKAKKLSDAQSIDIPSNVLVPSKYNDHPPGASSRRGLPMPIGTNTRITPRGKQATTPLSNQKTLSSSMMSNAARASGSFTSPDAFMGRSVRRLVIDSSSISAGNDSWVNKLLPQRVNTPSNRPETVDSPEPWSNRMNGDERDANKTPPGVEAWPDVRYQDETYGVGPHSPEQKFLPSPEAVQGNSAIVGSASKNITSNLDDNCVGGKNDKNDDNNVEINPNAPQMTKPHYKLKPSLAVLKMMTDEELSCVKNFTIERRDEKDYNSLLAEIEWIEAVDLRGVNLDDIVQMSHMEVAVYEDSTYKPLYGDELNKPCLVTLYRVLPKKNQTVEQALKKWKKAIEKDGTKILSYDEFSKFDIDGPPIGRLIFQTQKWC